MEESMKNYLNQTDKTVEDELHDECGVFGAYDFDGNDVASTIYYGLFALQHRGQESCGIAVTQKARREKSLHTRIWDLSMKCLMQKILRI